MLLVLSKNVVGCESNSLKVKAFLQDPIGVQQHFGEYKQHKRWFFSKYELLPPLVLLSFSPLGTFWYILHIFTFLNIVSKSKPDKQIEMEGVLKTLRESSVELSFLNVKLFWFLKIIPMSSCTNLQHTIHLRISRASESTWM